MKLYKIFLKENQKNITQDIIFLKEGFSFSALIFGPIWLIFYKMWRCCLFFITATCATILIANLKILSEPELVIIRIGLLLILANNANYWRSNFLLKNIRHQFLGFIVAKNKNDAIDRLCYENLSKDQLLKLFK